MLWDDAEDLYSLEPFIPYLMQAHAMYQFVGFVDHPASHTDEYFLYILNTEEGMELCRFH